MSKEIITIEEKSKELLKKSQTKRLQDALIRPSVLIPKTHSFTKNTQAPDLEIKIITPEKTMPFVHFEALTQYLQAYDEILSKNFEKAVKIYKKIVFWKENLFEIFNNIGVCFFKLNLNHKALKFFRKTKKLNSFSYIPYYNTAIIRLSEKNYGKTVLVIDKAMMTLANPPKELFLIREYALSGQNREKPQSKESHRFVQRLSSVSTFISPSKSKSVKSSKYQKNMQFWIEEPHDRWKLDQSASKTSSKHSQNSITPIHSPKKVKIKSSAKAQNNPKVLNKSSNSGNQWSKNFEKESLCQPESLEKGFVQIENSNISPIEKVFESPITTNKIRKCIHNLQSELVKDVFINLDEIHPSKIETIKINTQNLNFIASQYEKRPFERNYSKIDEILATLTFFAKFSPNIRTLFYKSSGFYHYLAGTIIFNQGDVGDHMYIIIKGSVSIEKKNSDLRNSPIVVNSLYDGNHFGDLALNWNQTSDLVNIRAATCVCSEDSYFFSISKRDYQKILMDVYREEIAKKIEFFATLNLFKGIPSSFLMNLATNIEAKTFGVDEIVIRQGEFPKGLYIIYSGQAGLYTQGYRLRTIENSISNKSIKKDRSLSVEQSRKRIKNHEAISVLKRIVFNDVGPVTVENEKKIKKFVSSKGLNEAKKEKDSYIIKEWLEFASLKSRDYFGGRMLFSSNDDFSLACKFTIVAKSSEVKVFLIERSHVQLLNEDVAFQLRTVLAKSYEVDCPPELEHNQLDKTFVEWQKFKQDLLDDIKMARYLDKKKIFFPFVKE